MKLVSSPSNAQQKCMAWPQTWLRKPCRQQAVDRVSLAVAQIPVMSCVLCRLCLQNWPSCCPFIYHNIREQIPPWNRSMMRVAYLVELISIAGFFYNAIIILATLFAKTGVSSHIIASLTAVSKLVAHTEHWLPDFQAVQTKLLLNDWWIWARDCRQFQGSCVCHIAELSPFLLLTCLLLTCLLLPV